MDEQKITAIAIINARCTNAMIRAMGMQAENDQRKQLGHSMAYGEKEFLNVIEEEGIGHNAVYSLLYNVV